METNGDIFVFKNYTLIVKPIVLKINSFIIGKSDFYSYLNEIIIANHTHLTEHIENL